MVKPNRTFTLPELKAYVREKKLNKPEIKLSMKKADLIAGLKKHGHWNHKADARIELKKGTKPPMTKKKKTQPKKPKPKSGKNTYYVEARGTGEVTEAEMEEWKEYKTSGDTSFMMKKMTSEQADDDFIWEEKTGDSKRQTSINKKL